MKVVILLKDGAIHRIYANDPNIKVLALDADTDGCDESSEIEVGGETYGLDAMAQALPGVAPKSVESYFEKIEKVLRKRPKGEFEKKILARLFGEKKAA